MAKNKKNNDDDDQWTEIAKIMVAVILTAIFGALYSIPYDFFEKDLICFQFSHIYYCRYFTSHQYINLFDVQMV